MAVNNTVAAKEYALTGQGTDTFPITFEFTTDDNGDADNIHCQLAEKNDVGEYVNSQELTAGIAGQFQVEGGNVKFLDDQPEYDGKFLVIYRSTPVTQLTDFIDNGNYSLEDIEKALDKLTFMVQERTGTPTGTSVNVTVSLFFASVLQLVDKYSFLKRMYENWDDIPGEKHAQVAAWIRSIINAVANFGNETINGTKTFSSSPLVPDLTGSSAGGSAANKTYVDNFFPVATANIGNSQVTTAKIADANVTTAKIADSNVTTAKIADGNVTYEKYANGSIGWDKIANGTVVFPKFRTSSATVSMTGDGDNYYGKWSNGGNKILYGISGTATICQQFNANNGGITYHFRKTTSGDITVYYVY